MRPETKRWTLRKRTFFDKGLLFVASSGDCEQDRTQRVRGCELARCALQKCDQTWDANPSAMSAQQSPNVNVDRRLKCDDAGQA